MSNHYDELHKLLFSIHHPCEIHRRDPVRLECTDFTSLFSLASTHNATIFQMDKSILHSPSNTLLLLKYFFSIKKIILGFPIAVNEGRGVGLHLCIPCEMFKIKRPSAFTRQGYSLFFLLFPLFQAAVAKRRRVLAHLLRIQLNYLQPDTSAKRLNHKRWFYLLGFHPQLTSGKLASHNCYVVSVTPDLRNYG